MEKKRIIAVIHVSKKQIACGAVLTLQAADTAEAEKLAFNLAKVTDATVHLISPTVYILVN